jgi:hypothetical protein
MNIQRWRKTSRNAGQSGQAMLFIILALGLALLGMIAFAVDMGNLWFHRQNAQTTADAACTAAAMDMLFTATGGGAKGGFTPGTGFSCSGNTTVAPCVYASKNMGFDASTLTAGTPGYDVSFTFPASVTGLPNCTTGTGAPAICNDPDAISNNFVQVNVQDRVRLSFAALLSGSSTTDVGAQAKCGVVLANTPIPILVLDPRSEPSLTGNGNINIAVLGGPQRSIQVNATASNAVNISGASGAIDLTHGGPNNNGSDFGVTGSTSQVGIFQTANSGQWIAPTPAISDPFATIPAPPVPGAPQLPTGADTIPGCAAIPCHVSGSTTPPFGPHGCQDVGNGCEVYTPGLYTTSNAIATFKKTLLFDPGVYYMQSDLAGNQQTCLRPSTAAGDGSGGTMFYFSGTHTLSIGANSGTFGVCGNTAIKVPLSTLRCINSGTGTTILPDAVVTAAGLAGNVLLGPCQASAGGGTNYGDPLGVNDPLGEQRGMLFFQDRSANLAAAGNQPSWGGGGSFGLTGIMYFHYCNSADGAGKGTNCNTAAYTDQLKLQGGSCSSTFVIGDVVTDKLDLGGNPCIEMDLNPNALFYVFKASLLQ